MTRINEITDHLLVQCPKCKTGQFMYEWGCVGNMVCKYLGEDGKSPCGNIWTIAYDPELILEEAKKIIQSNKGVARVSKPKEMKLQKINDGWIGVLQ